MSTTRSVALKCHHVSGTMTASTQITQGAPQVCVNRSRKAMSRPERRLIKSRSGDAPRKNQEAGRAYRKQATTTTSVRARPWHHGKAQLTRRYEASPCRVRRTLRRPMRNARRQGAMGRKLMLESTGRWETRRLWTPRDIYRADYRSSPTRLLRGVPSLTYGPKQRSLTVTETSDSASASQETSLVVRPRNVLWDALVTAFGYSPQLRGEQKLWGRVCVELGEAGATPVQVAAAARAYLERYPGVAFTPTALVKHWSQLLAPDARSQQPSQAVRLLRIADDLEAAG